jgi:glutamate synthase domain-containing protein 3
MPPAGSKKAKEILDSWATSLGKFKQLVPPSEAGTPEASPEAEASAGNGAGPQEAKSAVPVASAA